METESAPIRYVAELVGADADSERAIRVAHRTYGHVRRPPRDRAHGRGCGEAQRGVTMSKSYIRSSDGATMVEVEPHQYVNRQILRSKAASPRATNTAKQPRLWQDGYCDRPLSSFGPALRAIDQGCILSLSTRRSHLAPRPFPEAGPFSLLARRWICGNGAKSVMFTISLRIATPLRNDPISGGIVLGHGSKKECFCGPKSECADAAAGPIARFAGASGARSQL